MDKDYAYEILVFYLSVFFLGGVGCGEFEEIRNLVVWRCLKIIISPLISQRVLQAVYVLFSDDGAMKLPYCITISGIVCAMFAIGIPHLSALRIWLGFSTFFSLVYIVVAIVLAARDGTISNFYCVHNVIVHL